MCHHVDEASSWNARERRHRSEAADDPSEEPRDSTGDPREEAVDDEIEEPEPPAEPRAPADD